jgi:hypothetical protein
VHSGVARLALPGRASALALDRSPSSHPALSVARLVADPRVCLRW